MRTVVALGGNALAPGGEATIADQRERIAETADELRDLHEAGHDLVVTHGNGPQVGALLRQQEESDAPERPLDVLVAETQAQIGYLLQQALDERVDALTAQHGEIHQDRVSVDCPEERKEPVLSELEGALPDSMAGAAVDRVSTVDGFKLALADGTWVLVRPSGTEPKMRVYAEAGSRERVDALLAAGRDLVEPVV